MPEPLRLKGYYRCASCRLPLGPRRQSPPPSACPYCGITSTDALKLVRGRPGYRDRRQSGRETPAS
jgi:hypothetical protein